MRWMNLEPIIQSEVSQKEKYKCRILKHIYMESKKMALMNLFSGQQWRNREQTHGHSGRRGGRRGDVWRERNLQYRISNRQLMGIYCMI